MTLSRKSTPVTEEMVEACIRAMQRKAWLYSGWRRYEDKAAVYAEVRYFLEQSAKAGKA